MDLRPHVPQVKENLTLRQKTELLKSFLIYLYNQLQETLNELEEKKFNLMKKKMKLQSEHFKKLTLLVLLQQELQNITESSKNFALKL